MQVELDSESLLANTPNKTKYTCWSAGVNDRPDAGDAVVQSIITRKRVFGLDRRALPLRTP
jgi:hypothetical protein